MNFDGRLESMHIEGFRSLVDVTFRPRPGVTVLIGPNGAGKSNFVHFFKMMKAMLYEQRLAHFVGLNGGADDQLFGGADRTAEMNAALVLSHSDKYYEYAFRLALGREDRFQVGRESLRGGESEGDLGLLWESPGNGDSETRITETVRIEHQGEDKEAAQCFRAFAEDLGVYQFHDTSDHSAFNKLWKVDDWMQLRPDGGNIAAVLRAMEKYEADRYRDVRRRIRWVLPVFDDFLLEEKFGRVMLRWRARTTGKRIGPHLTSDGSLRFFALVTLLSSSAWLPRVTFLDEPELGLHPDAVVLVAEMIRSVAPDRQIIVATQSPFWVSQFPLEDIQVLELEEGGTRIRTLDSDRYRSWIEDGFAAGELWQKNLLGGNP